MPIPLKVYALYSKQSKQLAQSSYALMGPGETIHVTLLQSLLCLLNTQPPIADNLFTYCGDKIFLIASYDIV